MGNLPLDRERQLTGQNAAAPRRIPESARSRLSQVTSRSLPAHGMWPHGKPVAAMTRGRMESQCIFFSGLWPKTAPPRALAHYRLWLQTSCPGLWPLPEPPHGPCPLPEPPAHDLRFAIHLCPSHMPHRHPPLHTLHLLIPTDAAVTSQLSVRKSANLNRHSRLS